MTEAWVPEEQIAPPSARRGGGDDRRLLHQHPARALASADEAFRIRRRNA